MIIRKATIKDFEMLKKIKTEFYLIECIMDNRLDPNYAKKKLAVRLMKNLKNKNVAYFLAIENGNIIGYGAGEIEDNLPVFKQKKRGHLFHLYVKPDYRSKGVGKRLINEVNNWFMKKKIKDLGLMTYYSNKKAQKLYRKLGYKDYILIFRK